MRTRTVVLSYAILALSAFSLFGVGFLVGGYGYSSSVSSFYGFAGPLGLFLMTLAIAGLVLGPYFGLAGLIVRDGSVWVEVNRMIHSHISFPILAGLILFYPSFFSGDAGVSLGVLPVYLAVVFVGTLLSFMATKKSRPQPVTVAPAPKL